MKFGQVRNVINLGHGTRENEGGYGCYLQYEYFTTNTSLYDCSFYSALGNDYRSEYQVHEDEVTVWEIE